MSGETAGAKLRREIEQQLDDAELRLDVREEALLGQACDTATLLEALQEHIDEHGPVSIDPKTGASVVSAAVVEARLARQTLQRLLSGIDLGTGKPPSLAQQHGRRTANRRYGHRGKAGR